LGIENLAKFEPKIAKFVEFTLQKKKSQFLCQKLFNFFGVWNEIMNAKGLEC
jgi:hypothetical protein